MTNDATNPLPSPAEAATVAPRRGPEALTLDPPIDGRLPPSVRGVTVPGFEVLG